MKILIFTIILLISAFASAQAPVTDCEVKTIKVKPIQANLTQNCTENDKQNARVLAFKVIKEKDRQVYGNTIYAITPCIDHSADVSLPNKHEYDLEISECRYYQWEMNIFDEQLLKLNSGEKRFWNRGISSKVAVICTTKGK